MILTKPGVKDLSILKAGTSREAVVEELGTPKRALENSGCHDEFVFEGGYSTGEKIARTGAALIYDFLTMGAGESTISAYEAQNRGYVGIVVHYDTEIRVIDACTYQGWTWLAGSDYTPPTCDDDFCPEMQ